MAQHIDSVAGSDISQVTRAKLYTLIRPGDLLFCWGGIPISEGIEKFTGGPSHVLKVWTFPAGPWLTLEAEFGHGVRFGQFADYLTYPGDIVLCRRPLTIDQIDAEIAFGATLLDYKYDTIEFVSLVARRFSTIFPLIQPKDELHCSALQQAIAAVSVPFNVPDVPWATPEQLFTEDSVTPICAVMASNL